MVTVIIFLTIMAPAVAQNDSLGTKLIDLEFTNADLSKVFEALFVPNGISYIVDPAVLTNIPQAGSEAAGNNGLEGHREGISVHLKQVTFQTALRALAKTLGFQYSILDGVYIIKPSTLKDYAPTIENAKELEDQTTETKEPEIVKIRINYVDCYDIVAVLLGQTNDIRNRSPFTFGVGIGMQGNQGNIPGSYRGNGQGWDSRGGPRRGQGTGGW